MGRVEVDILESENIDRAVQGTNKQPPVLLGHDHSIYDTLFFWM